MIDEATIALGVAAIVLLAKYRMDSFRSSVVDTPPMVLRSQTHFSQTRNKGEWAIARNRATPFPTKNHPQFVNSLFDALQKLLADSSPSCERPLIHYKPISSGPFVSVSVKQVGKLANETGSGLISLLGKNNGGRLLVGAFLTDSSDVVDLVALDFASVLFGFVVCWWKDPVVEKVDQGVLNKMLTLTEMRAVIVSVSVLDTALAVAGQSKKLEHIIVAGVKTIDRTYLERAAALNVTLSTMDSIRIRGEENSLDPVKSEQTDTASIIFEHCSDSGIKGSVLTHSNVAVAISSVYVTLPQVEKLNESDVCLIRSQSGSSFEYTLVYALLFAGAQVAFSNSTNTFLDEISALKPTLLTTSSQHLSIISKAINEHPSAKSFGYKTAVSVKRQELKEGRCWTGTVYDQFLKPIEQGLFGGKLRVIWNLHSEGTPGTDLNDVETIRSVLGTQVLETFSRAEACGLVSSSMYGDYEKANHIGVPAANLEYKLIDAPGKKYFVSDLPNPRGAICIRGPGVSKVYFNDAGKSASVVDEDGWVRLAGAFGEVRPNGTLTLL